MTVLAAVNVEAVVDLRDRRLDHAGDHLVGVQAHDRRRHLLGRRPLDHGRAERPGDLRRLPQRASFLGIAGLIFLYGFDGFLYSVGFLVAFLTVMFLLAERMRNAASTRSPTS